MSRDPVYGQLENTIANWTEEVTQAHSQLTSQIAEARDQLDTLSTIMAKRQGESSALSKSREDIARLKEAVRKRDAELQQVQLERETLARRNSLAEQQKLQAEERIAALRREKEHLDHTLGESRTETREALGRVSTLEIELAACRSTIQEQQRDAEGDKARIDSLNERVSQLQQELAELTRRALASDHENGTLSDRLASAQAENVSAREELLRKHDELRQLGGMLAEREVHVESAQRQLLENQNEIGCLEVEIQRIIENRDALAEEAGLLHEDKASLEGRIAQMAQQAWDVRRDNEQLIETLASLREALAESARALEETTNALQDLQQAHAELQENFEQCQADLLEASRCAQQRQDDYVGLQDAHQQVQAALNSYRETLDSLKQERAVLEQERTALTQELELRNSDLAESRLHGESLDGENTRLDARRAELEDSLSANCEALRTATERYECTAQSLSETQAQLADAESRLNGLRAREHDLTTQLDVAMRQIADGQRTTGVLRAELDERNQAIREAGDEIASLRANLWNAGAEKGALQDQLTEMEARMERLQREGQATERELHGQLIDRDFSISELDKALASLREELSRAGIENGEIQARAKRLEVELEGERAALAEARQALAETQHALAALGSENALLASTLEETHQSNAALHDSLRLSEGQARGLASDFAALRDEHTAVGSALAEARQSNAALHDSLRISEDRGRTLDADLAALRNEHVVLGSALADVRQSNDALNDSLRNSEEQGNALRAEFAALRDERDAVGRALAEAHANLELRQQDLARLSDDQDALEQRHADTLVERDRLVERVTALEQSQHSMEQDLRMRMATIETLEADLEAGRQRHGNLEQLLATERAEYAATLTSAREEQQSLLRAIDQEQAAATQLQSIIREHESVAAVADRRINHADSAIASLTTQARDLQAQFAEELRQAKAHQEESEALLQHKEHELTQRATVIKQRESELETANRTLARLEQALAAQKDQIASVRASLECDIDAANNRVRATEAALQGTRAENSALANVLKEKEDLIGREQRTRQQLEAVHRALAQDLDTAKKRVSITEAENESLATQLGNATHREKETARELSLAQATIRALQETLQQKESAVQQEKIRTAQLLHHTVSALQSELTQINTTDGNRGPTSNWMSALNLGGLAQADGVQRELPFSEDEGGPSANGNGTRNGAGHSYK